MNDNPSIAKENKYCAANYHPLPVVLSHGEGIYVFDDAGKRYIDMMSAYSAVSHGHCHPKLLAALTEQSQRINVISRAFYSDKLGDFLEKLCQMLGYEKALPMNTGAEAVETALKAARKWAYQKKGVAADKAEIIVCDGNFHGRTIAIVGFSSEAQYKEGFGPYPTGFKQVAYGDIDALEKAITSNTAAFFVEPIQGEGGIIMPPAGYLKQAKALCEKHNVLLICDEIQTGLGRTGKLLASYHDEVRPDAVVLGKALGGGVLPVSAFVADSEIMDVFTPGDHGSTFGGYPLAAAVGLAALNVLEKEKLAKNSAELGEYFKARLEEADFACVSEVRGVGLFIGLEINPAKARAREICEKLMTKGLLSKETHETVVRLAPPLVINKEQLDSAFDIIHDVLSTYN